MPEAVHAAFHPALLGARAGGFLPPTCIKLNGAIVAPPHHQHQIIASAWGKNVTTANAGVYLFIEPNRCFPLQIGFVAMHLNISSLLRPANRI